MMFRSKTREPMYNAMNEFAVSLSPAIDYVEYAMSGVSYAKELLNLAL
jgi:hypothetical protein